LADFALVGLASVFFATILLFLGAATARALAFVSFVLATVFLAGSFLPLALGVFALVFVFLHRVSVFILFQLFALL